VFKAIQNGKNQLESEMSGKLKAEEMKIALDELEGILYPGLQIKFFKETREYWHNPGCRVRPKNMVGKFKVASTHLKSTSA
jgi:hypothetical protein